MSAADKAKLDGIAAGAQANAVTSVNGKTGEVKLEIGGRNLALNSAKFDIDAGSGNRYVSSYIDGLIAARADGLNELRLTGTKFKGIGVYANSLSLNAGDEIVFSCFADAVGGDNKILFYAMCFDASGTRVYRKLYIDNNAWLDDSKHFGTIEAGGTKRLVVKIKWSDEAKSLIDGGGRINLTFQIGVDVASGDYVSMYAPKLERGNQATDWTPAPEDKEDAGTCLPLTGGTLTGNVAAPTFTGSLVGNASTASKLSTARTISLTGAVTGSAKFDGSGDVTITTVGQSAAAQFLAAYPVGSYYYTSNASFNPATYGGTWERVYSIGGPITWHRTA